MSEGDPTAGVEANRIEGRHMGQETGASASKGDYRAVIVSNRQIGVTFWKLASNITQTSRATHRVAPTNPLRCTLLNIVIQNDVYHVNNIVGTGLL